MKQHLILIFTTAAHYREAIYSAIDNEYDCEWHFRKATDGIKEMDLSLLKNTNYFEHYGNHRSLYWKRGILSLLFKKENRAFFTIAESRSVTDYLFFGLSRLLKKKVYVWTHGLYGKESRLQLALKKWQYRHVDGVFVFSCYARNLMIEQGIPANNVFCIYNSLDYRKQTAIRDSIKPSEIYKEHFGNNNPTIIFIGRLTPEKKLIMLIEALATLKTRGEHYNLVFVGDGTERNNLMEKTKDLGISDDVWFYGACYDESRNAELLYNAALCVSPGNVGLTAIHALTYGCPVITHNCFKKQMPEFEAIQAGITGDFFEMDNVDSLTDTISNWFAENHSNRDEIRNACYREIGTRWNPDHQMEVIKQNLKV